MPHLMPRQSVPELAVPTLAGGTWSLAAAKPERFTLIVFYRGLHCPICKTYVSELARLEPDFAQRGVQSIAISSDTEERARKAQADWNLSALNVGYALPLSVARAWGLYISNGRGLTSIGIEEPAQFNEPGFFFVRADRTLYYASVQTMPFARPQFRDLLGALDFVIAKDYPARGEA
jgi:peroxiredoxin